MNLGSDSILSVYSDARAEYTKQLCVFLVPAYFQFFIDLLEKAKLATSLEPKKTLWQFQTYLNEIHDWNMEKVNNEIHLINMNCGCDYLEDLLTAVFIAHTKVLTAIRLNSHNKKVNITVPKVEHFLFKVLCESSKLLWSSTFLFREGISSIEKQQNYRSIEQILNEGILQAVRSLVPVKSILKDFVNNDDSDDDVNDQPTKDEPTRDEPIQQEQPIYQEQLEQLEQLHNNSNEYLEQENQLEQEQKQDGQNQVESVEPVEQIPITQSPPIINLEERSSVQFADFDAVFDSDNPMSSDMIFDPKDEEDDPGLEILDTEGTTLNEGEDFDNLDEENDVDIPDTDYEVLV